MLRVHRRSPVTSRGRSATLQQELRPGRAISSGTATDPEIVLLNLPNIGTRAPKPGWRPQRLTHETVAVYRVRSRHSQIGRLAGEISNRSISRYLVGRAQLQRQEACDDRRCE